MTAHQGKQTVIAGAGRIEVSPRRQEVVIDQANGMETVGDDDSLEEVFVDRGAVMRRQAFADDANVGFTFQASQNTS